MNYRRTFYFKLAYAIGIAALLFPLSLLSSPETRTSKGGKLAQLQREHRLAQADLGEIDPASETMRFATFGLRGVATQLLWNKANEAKKKEDWTTLTATLEQLARLQPNFITFWKFQSWNVSYNVSVQFDDYRDRYYYVRRGIEFLTDGVEYNRESLQIPQLLWDLGWFIGQKIGRADEYVQYRRLFKNDPTFHPEQRPLDQRDNWLVSKEEYNRAIDAVDRRGKSLGRKSPKIFYSSPAKSQMSYAEAIEEEGDFERGPQAWAVAADMWRDFGQRVIEHSTGVMLRLGAEEEYAQQVEKLAAQLEALRPGERDRLAIVALESLTEEERTAIETPEAERTPVQVDLSYKVQDKLNISDFAVAESIGKSTPDQRRAAAALAAELGNARALLSFTQRYKVDSNYDYWKVRADFEQTASAVAARQKMFAGKQAFQATDIESAVSLYNEGFAKWREVLDTFPVLMDDEGPTGGDLMFFIDDYKQALDAGDLPIPDNFPLWDVIEKFDLEQKYTEEIREHRIRTGRGDENPPTDATPATEAEPAATEPATEGEAATEQAPVERDAGNYRQARTHALFFFPAAARNGR